MKTAILSLLASLSFAPVAFASMPVYPNMNGQKGMPNVDVYYASWCQGNAVVTNNNGYEQRVQCNEFRKMCIQQERRVSAVQIIVYATCEYPR
ncbi:MAG TPA: hypothetical protein PL182_11945 [Pseudobdellovibrionaceae bacterium]|nr:hypothetical protein [Pseudobdellovibrionaceae bacterium]